MVICLAAVNTLFHAPARAKGTTSGCRPGHKLRAADRYSFADNVNVFAGTARICGDCGQKRSKTKAGRLCRGFDDRRHWVVEHLLVPRNDDSAICLCRADGHRLLFLSKLAVVFQLRGWA